MSERTTVSHRDPVIEAHKKDVDRTILRATLKLSVEERLRALMRLQRAALELRRAGRDARNVLDRV